MKNAKLKGWMKANGITRAVLADMMEMSFDTLSTRIDGRVEWRYSEIKKLLKVTNCSYYDLF